MQNVNSSYWSTIISAITLIVAIVSPVLVTILNNRHNTKLKNLELKYEKYISYYQKQETVFNKFINYASKRLEANYQSERVEYIHCYNELFLYTPEKYWKDFEELNNLIISREKDDATEKLSSVSKTLGEILRESDQLFPKL